MSQSDSNPTSAPVDVLAVLSELRRKWLGETTYSPSTANCRAAWNEIDKVRAAVAELISAAEDVEKGLPAAHCVRLRAAIANVGGAQ